MGKCGTKRGIHFAAGEPASDPPPARTHSLNTLASTLPTMLSNIAPPAFPLAPAWPALTLTNLLGHLRPLHPRPLLTPVPPPSRKP